VGPLSAYAYALLNPNPNMMASIQYKRALLQQGPLLGRPVAGGEAAGTGPRRFLPGARRCVRVACASKSEPAHSGVESLKVLVTEPCIETHTHTHTHTYTYTHGSTSGRPRAAPPRRMHGRRRPPVRLGTGTDGVAMSRDPTRLIEYRHSHSLFPQPTMHTIRTPNCSSTSRRSYSASPCRPRPTSVRSCCCCCCFLKFDS